MMLGKSAMAFAVLAVGAIGIGMAGDEKSAVESTPSFEPVMPLYALMIEQDRHFEQIRNLIRKDREDRFGRLKQAGMAMAELANVNGYHDEAIKHADFRQWTLDIKSDGMKIAELAREEKLDEIKQVAKRINNTCSACHDKYQ